MFNVIQVKLRDSGDENELIGDGTDSAVRRLIACNYAIR